MIYRDRGTDRLIDATRWIGSSLAIWQPEGGAVTVSEGDFVVKDSDGAYRCFTPDQFSARHDVPKLRQLLITA